MNNTIPNVPRELLADLLGNDHDKRIMAERHLLAMLANAPSPAGVDGLEVVATAILGGVEYGIGGPELGEIDVELSMSELCRIQERMVSNEDSVYLDLCSLSAAQAIIDGLRGEVGAQRVKTCIALKERNDAREERDRQAQRIGELEGLLRHAQKQVPTGSGLHMRIDAALSAGKEGE